MSHNRTILVTGCSDGSLGSALAIALHHQGWRVFASARNTSKLDVVRAAGIECVQLDVVSDESVSACVKQIQKLTDGSLDALINNAGAGYSMPLIHMDFEKAHELFELNTFSIIRVTRAFLPLLLKSRHTPLIANNTSAAGLFGAGIPFQGTYNASKAAAISMTENLRLELGAFGVRMVNIVTGMVQSTFVQNAPRDGLPPGSIYEPAKEKIEAAMSGPPPDFRPIDAATWAKQVAGDLSRNSPPHLIYRGTKAGTARLVTFLPLGSADGLMKKSVGIDVLEKRVQEKGDRV